MRNSQFAAELATAIRDRRSIRSYLPEPIAETEILEILALAGRAPSAWNLQPWRFVVATDPEMKSALQKVAFGQAQVGRAPVVIVLYGDIHDSLNRVDEVLPRDAAPATCNKIRADITNFFQKLTAEQRNFWGRCQTYIALGYLLLILESRGYGSSPMLGFDPAGVRRLLNLPDHAEVAALVAFGKPADRGRQSARHDGELMVRFL
jgi:nitroreductase